jgi:hypothetical protein
MSIREPLERSGNKGESEMPKYALLLGGTDLDKRSGNAALAPQMYERFASWLSSLGQGGRRVEPHKLRDQSGVRLSVRGGQVVEGPFMEAKEAVGGIVFLDAATLEEAVAIARTCPIFELQNGAIEVRVVEEPRRTGGES